MFAAVAPVEAALVNFCDVLARSAVPEHALVVIRAVHHVHDLATLGVLQVQTRILDSLHLHQCHLINSELTEHKGYQLKQNNYRPYYPPLFRSN